MADQQHPNILLIVSDQHRRDWMGCAGSRVVRTPHLDALAARGMRFTGAYCAAPICGPCRMALMSGRHPHQLGIYTNENTMRSDVPTFAHALGIAGYETVLCGRMHFSGIDQRHGFEKRLVGDWNCAYAGGEHIQSEIEHRETSSALHAATLGRPGDHLILHFDEAVTAGAERFLAERRDARPLLMVAGLFEPHHAFVAEPEDFAQAMQVMDDPETGELGHPAVVERWAQAIAKLPITAEQVRRTRAAYAGMIASLDRRIGRILAAAAQHLQGPTLVIYTSDHGEMAGDRGLYGKTVFYEASSGVPFIAAPLDPAQPVPGCPITAGSACHTPIALTDLAPTLAAVGAAPAMPGTVGRALQPLLGGTADASWEVRPVFSELCLRWFVNGRKTTDDPATRMVRRGRWKLVYYHGAGKSWRDPVTLHDLEADPHERHDRAADPACREVRDSLLAELLADWDPEAVSRDAEERCIDQEYQTRWAHRIGRTALGRVEQFDPKRPYAVFGPPGVPV